MKNMNTIMTQPVEQNSDMLITEMKPKAPMSVEVQGETFTIIDVLRNIRDSAREIKEYAVGPKSIEEFDAEMRAAGAKRQ